MRINTTNKYHLYADSAHLCDLHFDFHDTFGESCSSSIYTKIFWIEHGTRKKDEPLIVRLQPNLQGQLEANISFLIIPDKLQRNSIATFIFSKIYHHIESKYRDKIIFTGRLDSAHAVEPKQGFWTTILDFTQRGQKFDINGNEGTPRFRGRLNPDALKYPRLTATPY